VTQRYHLPRALVLCRAVGIQAVGVAADLHPYDIRSLVLWKMREVPATAIALWEAYHARHTQPAVTVTPADPEMPPDGP
jgi:vancomycin permeability regulator SanA